MRHHIDVRRGFASGNGFGDGDLSNGSETGFGDGYARGHYFGDGYGYGGYGSGSGNVSLTAIGRITARGDGTSKQDPELITR